VLPVSEPRADNAAREVTHQPSPDADHRETRPTEMGLVSHQPTLAPTSAHALSVRALDAVRVRVAGFFAVVVLDMCAS
jgi:hypothetical protein